MMKKLILMLVLVVFCMPALVEALTFTATPTKDAVISRGADPSGWGPDAEILIRNGVGDLQNQIAVQCDVLGRECMS